MMRRIPGLLLTCVLAASAAAYGADSPAPAAPAAKEPAISLRLWTSAGPGGERADRFLPGQRASFNVEVAVQAADARRQAVVSLWLTGPDGWRADLLPRVESTVGKLPPSIARAYDWPDDMLAGLCGPYEFRARVECRGLAPVEKAQPFKVEPPVVLEQAWVDTMPLALPRPTSNRLYEGAPFYFHARHRLSDLVDTEKAHLTVEWRVRHAGQDVAALSTSVSKSLVGDPQALVLTRTPSPRPAPASLLGVSVMECTARLGKFVSSPVRATFVLARQPVSAAPGEAVVKLQSVLASPKVVRPGGDVSLAMKYSVSGLRPGEVLGAIERQIISGGGQDVLLPMRSVQRLNGTYEVKALFHAPEGARGKYVYEAAVIGDGRKLCKAEAAFEVREVEVSLSGLSIWPAELRAGEVVAVAFGFSVQGLGPDESLAVERIVEVQGPWSTRVTKKGTLSGAPGVSYRTRLEISLPEDAPAGKYAVRAMVVPERGSANELEGSFNVTEQGAPGP